MEQVHVIRHKVLIEGQSQREVAQQLGVDPMSISYWETNKYAPSLREIPKIIGFLGYLPYDTSRMSLGERIITTRRCLRLSHEELAKRLGVDESTLRDWEHWRRRPLKRNLERLEELCSYVLSPPGGGEPLNTLGPRSSPDVSTC